jgi:hypothetical protein
VQSTGRGAGGHGAARCTPAALSPGCA